MSELIIELTDGQFKDEVESSDLPVMIDFWASWCGPCKMMEPIVGEIADEFKNRLKIVRVSVDNNQAVASKLSIMNIPTFVFFKGGKELSRLSGAVPKRELIRRIEEIIGE